MNRARGGSVITGVRFLRIARRVYQRGGEITAQWIMAEFGVSKSTAKHDMQLVGMYLPVVIIKPQRWLGKDPRAKRIKLARGAA